MTANNNHTHPEDPILAASYDEGRQRLFSNPFSFEGRIGRTEFVISVILFSIIGTYLRNNYLDLMPSVEYYLALLGWFPLNWFILAQATKRCHDLGKIGWWQFVPFYVLWLLFQSGQRGSNYYGRNPTE